MTTRHSTRTAATPIMTSCARSSTMRGATKLAILGVLPVLVAACSPAPMPISRSSTDPSSPSAPEGVSPTVPEIAPPAPAPREGHEHQHQHQHHHHDHGAPAAASSPESGHDGHAGAQDGGAKVVHVCPMHPEVTSNGPGICPKCNMKLVPKK